MYCWLCAHAFVGASDVISSVLSIRFSHRLVHALTSSIHLEGRVAGVNGDRDGPNGCQGFLQLVLIAAVYVRVARHLRLLLLHREATLVFLLHGDAARREMTQTG